MDVEADPASEDHAILGKRKRSPGEQPPVTGTATTEHAADEVGQTPAQNVDSKRSRVPLATSLANETKLSTHERTQPVSDPSEFPWEVLQHVCSFLDPFSLGRLQCVNRKFRAVLELPSSLPPASGQHGIVPLQSPESVWFRSRAAFMPDAPAPLRGVTEKNMMRLLYGIRCQFCSRLAPLHNTGTPPTQWNAGPGPMGVRTIWPFKIQSCADCLRPRIIKEQDLILSPYSALQAGLPFACFTPSLNYVASSSFHQSSKPPHLQILKYYFRPQIEDLDKQANQIRSLAPAALPAWYKGIGPLLEDIMSEVAQIEQRELAWYIPNSTAHLWPDSSTVSSNSRHSGFHASSVAPSTLTSTTQSTWPGWSGAPKHRAPRASLGSTSSAALPKSIQSVSLHDQRMPGPPAPTHHSSSAPHRNLPSLAPSRSERSFHDVTRAKADRRTDIEDRCQNLDPPLLPPELHGMKAFNAAIQIAKPLDDKAWELLKSRLIDERQEQSMETRHDDSGSSYFPATETIVSSDIGPGRDRTPNVLDQARQSNKDKVQAIATDFIRRCYRSGTNLTADTVSSFAVDVLEHVAVQFYAMQAQEDAAFALQNREPLGNSSSGMRTRSLQLRHMRYVVDDCIIPCTDLIQKEIFQCSGCDASEKLFPFQGLIQHFAMKHTHSFSRGPHKIHWSSEWPRDNPPYRKPANAISANSSLLASGRLHTGDLNTPATLSRPPADALDDIDMLGNHQHVQGESTPRLSTAHSVGNARMPSPRYSTPMAEVAHEHLEYPSHPDLQPASGSQLHALAPHSSTGASVHDQHVSISRFQPSPAHSSTLHGQDRSRAGRQLTREPSQSAQQDSNGSIIELPPSRGRLSEHEASRGQDYRSNTSEFQPRDSATSRLGYAREDVLAAPSYRSSSLETRNIPLNDAEQFLQTFDPFENRMASPNHISLIPGPPHTYSVGTPQEVSRMAGRTSAPRQRHFPQHQHYHHPVDGTGSVHQRHHAQLEALPSDRFSRLAQGTDHEIHHGSTQPGSHHRFEPVDHYPAAEANDVRRAPGDQSRHIDRIRDHDRDLDHSYPQHPYRRSNNQLEHMPEYHGRAYRDVQYASQDYDDLERYPVQEHQRWDPHTQRYYPVQLQYVPIEAERATRDRFHQEVPQYPNSNNYRVAQEDEHYRIRRAERRE